MNVGRLARTLQGLHPIQLAARGPYAIVSRVVRRVPATYPPRVVRAWPPPPEALRRLANTERSRGAERLARLPAGSRLRAYEAHYGLELGADDAADPADWSGRVATESFPASVRARRIATAMRCGRKQLAPELARAARAVLLQPEVHLLGNHVLENGFALACAGAATRGGEAEIWWKAGARLLDWQLPSQFLDDGGHEERSASYHVALTAALLETIELAEASGRGAPPLWRATAARALGWILAVRTPDGTYPLFNDAALDAAPSVDDVLALGFALGMRPVAQVGQECGEPGARVLRIEPTGWIRLEVGDACLFVDAGPDVGGWQPAHTHADGLTLEAWLGTRRTLVDFGVASYEQGPARDATRATRSHNTVELDGLDSCEVWGAFRVGRRGRGSVASCRASAGSIALDLDHDGYVRTPGAPRHIRTLTLRAGRLDVVDRLPGASRDWSSRLRFDELAAVRVAGGSDIRGRSDVWYPRHGDPRPATLYEQRALPGDPSLRWNVEW